MIGSRVMTRFARLLVVATLHAACAPATPEPSASTAPSVTPAPSNAPADAALAVARQFAADWRGRRYEQLVEHVAVADRKRYIPAVIIGLLRQFDELAQVTDVVGETGPPFPSSAPADAPAEGPTPA